MTGKMKTAILLLLLCVLIAVIPLVAIRDSGFGGADGAAMELIAEINPGYEAWAAPVFEVPGGETESLLFCLQAAIGAGIFGYGFGVLRERYRKEEKEKDNADH